MPNYEDLKKKAKDAIDTIADISAEAYKVAEEKARILARRAKLNAEITREKSIVRRLKAEIGATYYDLHKDAPEEALKQNCEDVTASLERIDAKRKEIEELKAAAAGECCDCCADDAECEPAPEAETEPAPEESAPAADESSPDAEEAPAPEADE